MNLSNTWEGNHGWETRFAQKFGYIFAAMVMGIKAGLLPWPDSFPLQVVSRCYRKARRSAKTVKEQALEAAVKLHRLVLNEDRVVDVPSAKGHNTAIKITKRCIAIRYRKNGRRKFGVLDDALLKLLGSPKAKAAFMKVLATAGLLRSGHGHAGTIQERFKNKRDGNLHDSVRVWCVDAKRLSRFLKKKEINLQTFGDRLGRRLDDKMNQQEMQTIIFYTCSKLNALHDANAIIQNGN